MSGLSKEDTLEYVRVACPTCGMPPFFTCTTKSGRSHKARKKLAMEVRP